MRLDLSEIVIRDGMRSSVELEGLALDDSDLNLAAPVDGRVDFQNSGDLLNIKGHARAVLRLQCARCLADVDVAVAMQIDERLPLEQVTHPDRPVEEGAEGEIVVSEVVHLEAGRPILNMDELLRQQVVMEVPIRALCSETCKGLCQNCGADLNRGPCGCPPPEADPRLATLASLLEDPEK